MRYGSKRKVHKVSSTLKSGGAPVSHRLSVKPELQLHMKLPGMFMHEPPLRQPEFTDVNAHSSISKTHMHINVLLADCNCSITWLWLFYYMIAAAARRDNVVCLQLVHPQWGQIAHERASCIVQFNHELTSFLCKYLAEQTCSPGINNPTIQYLSMPTVESRLICIKTSSIRMSGAPVWHSLPVYPELQLHVKLPSVFMHDPPFWQRVFPDVDPHSSMSKAHITLKFCCLTATVFFTWL